MHLKRRTEDEAVGVHGATFGPVERVAGAAADAPAPAAVRADILSDLTKGSRDAPAADPVQNSAQGEKTRDVLGKLPQNSADASPGPPAPTPPRPRADANARRDSLVAATGCITHRGEAAAPCSRCGRVFVKSGLRVRGSALVCRGCSAR